MLVDSDPTDWVLTETDLEDLGPYADSAPSQWLVTLIDPTGGWLDSHPSGWVQTLTSPPDVGNSPPSGWVITQTTLQPTTGVYIVNTLDELVPVTIHTAAEFD